MIELRPAAPTRDSERSNTPSSTCSSTSRSTRTSSSDSSSSEGTSSASRTPKIFYTPGYNLHDQLTAIPETRFHAAWLMLRHFHLMSYVSMDDARTEKSEGDCLSEAAGFDLVLWDCAVACLALSVKVGHLYFVPSSTDVVMQFHRDFLEPLIPVLSREYLRLAPHEISYENLEVSARLYRICSVLLSRYSDCAKRHSQCNQLSLWRFSSGYHGWLLVKSSFFAGRLGV